MENLDTTRAPRRLRSRVTSLPLWGAIVAAAVFIGLAAASIGRAADGGEATGNPDDGSLFDDPGSSSSSSSSGGGGGGGDGDGSDAPPDEPAPPADDNRRPDPDRDPDPNPNARPGGRGRPRAADAREVLGAWEFDEGTGATAGDASPQRNPGKLVGGPTWAVGGPGRALKFDGVDDHVLLARPLPDAREITVEAWVKYEGQEMGTILCDSDPAPEFDFWLGVTANEAIICAGKGGQTLGDGRRNESGEPFERVPLGQNIRGRWVHLAWVVTGQQSVVYLDGKALGAVNEGGANIGNHYDNPTIGSWYGGPQDSRPMHSFFKGAIGALRLYGWPMTAGEVAARFQRDGGSALTRRTRVQPPKAAALAAAEKTVKEAFAAELAVSGLAAKATLAKQLLDAAQTEEDAAARFVLIREARDTAAAAGDLDAAMLAAAEMADAFVVDVDEAKIAALKIIARPPGTAGGGGGKEKLPPETYARVAEAAATIGDTLLAGGRFVDAVTAFTCAESAARAAKDPAVTESVKAGAKRARDVQTQYTRLAPALATLEAKPDDPAANTKAGRFYCFVAGDWERGLPMLARSSEPKLKAIAAKDLAAPKGPLARMALGDEWWDAAKGLGASGPAAAAVRERAVFWYEDALPALSGDIAARVRTRIEQAQSGGPAGQKRQLVDLLKLVNLKRDRVSGEWEARKGVVGCRDNRNARIQFPYKPPQEYDFRVSFTPVRGRSTTALIMPQPKSKAEAGGAAPPAPVEAPFPDGDGAGNGRGNQQQQFMQGKFFNFAVWPGSAGFEGLEVNKMGFDYDRVIGADAAADGRPIRRTGRTVIAGLRHTIVVKVRKAGVAAYVDGELVLKLPTDFSDCDGMYSWRLNDPQCLGIGANATETVFHAVEVLEISGRGEIVKEEK